MMDMVGRRSGLLQAERRHAESGEAGLRWAAMDGEWYGTAWLCCSWIDEGGMGLGTGM